MSDIQLLRDEAQTLLPHSFLLVLGDLPRSTSFQLALRFGSKINEEEEIVNSVRARGSG